VLDSEFVFKSFGLLISDSAESHSLLATPYLWGPDGRGVLSPNSSRHSLHRVKTAGAVPGPMRAQPGSLLTLHIEIERDSESTDGVNKGGAEGKKWMLWGLQPHP